jgi:GLUG motif-containing protein
MENQGLVAAFRTCRVEILSARVLERICTVAVLVAAALSIGCGSYGETTSSATRAAGVAGAGDDNDSRGHGPSGDKPSFGLDANHPGERPPAQPEPELPSFDVGSLFCGDRVRGRDEECDSGQPNDFCAAKCRAQSALVVRATPSAGAAMMQLAPEEPAPPPPLSSSSAVQAAMLAPVSERRLLGEGAHPLVAGDRGFAVTFVEADDEAAVQVALFASTGQRLGVHALGTGSADIAHPVVAALPKGRFAVAWSAFDADGDELGIKLQVVDQNEGPVGTPIVVNSTTVGAQYSPDIIWANDELVVAWTDTSDAATGPDIRYRTFNAELVPTAEGSLAAASATEGDVTLTPFAGGWAASWRSGDAGRETVVVSTAQGTFSIPGLQPGPAGDHVAMVELDPTRLLVAFTVGTDPEETGVLNVGRLQYAIVDVNGPTSVVAAPLLPLLDGYASATLDQSEPSVTHVGDHFFVAWRSDTLEASPRQQEVWLKKLSWDAQTATLNLATPERPLPFSNLHRYGDQRAPKLASAPSDSVLSAYVDYGRNLDGSASPDIVVQLNGMVHPCYDYVQQTAPPFALGMPVTPDGSALHPYPLCTVEQLQYVIDTVALQDKQYVLQADLDLQELTGALGRTTPFTGTFDGNGHIFTHYQSLRPVATNVGFIEQLQGDGTVDGVADGELKNLTFGEPRIEGGFAVGVAVGKVLGAANIRNVHVVGGRVQGNAYVGGLAGDVLGTFTDSTSSASVSAMGSGIAGGLVGQLGAGALLEHSSATGTVTASDLAGGLVGKNLGTVQRSYAMGAVSGTRAGGLIGQNSGSVYDAYARGAVAGTTAGGLVGEVVTGSDIQRCYASGIVTPGTETGALVGRQTGSGTYSATVWNNTVNASLNPLGSSSSVPAGVLGKTDSEMRLRASYVSQGWDFLNVWAIEELADYPILLTASYDFCKQVPQQNTPPFAVGVAADGTAAKPYPLCTVEQMQHLQSSPALWSKHFRLMGDIDLTGFTGTIGDINQYFTGGFDGNGRKLSNFSMTSTSWYAGLFGRVYGDAIIQRLTIESFKVNGAGHVGALVGFQLSGQLLDVHGIDVSVHMAGSTDALYAGGLVGRSRATLRDCTLSGAVTATNFRVVGGLVGLLEKAGRIEQSSSTGLVAYTGPPGAGAAGDVGGLVGEADGTVVDSFSSAAAKTGSGNLGGLIGHLAGGVVDRSSASGAVLNTELHQAGPSAGGLVGYTWQGTIRDSWATGTVVATHGGVGGLVGGANNNVTIANCRAEGDVTGDGEVGGLVGWSLGNVLIDNSHATGEVSSSYHFAGGLVARAVSQVVVRDCFATGNVSAFSFGGGLVGQAALSSQLLRSYSTGAVSGGAYLGGLVGGAGSGSSISESWTSGDVTQTSSVGAGGLIGSLRETATVANSYATGDVVANWYGGSLIGHIQETPSITSSYAAGAISGARYVGALVGVQQGTPTCNNVLWNTTLNGSLPAFGAGDPCTGVFGHTDAELKQQATYTLHGWDFATIWKIAEGASYAELQ